MATLYENRLAYSTEVNVQDHPLVRHHISVVHGPQDDLLFPLQLAFPAVTVCNKNRINCRVLNDYKELKNCSITDSWAGDCDSSVSEECEEICSMVEVACVADKEATISSCAGDSGEGSGSGKQSTLFVYSEV